MDECCTGTMTSQKQKAPPVQFYRRPLPEACISFCSEEGKTVFAEALHSGHLAGYFGLAAQFRTQDEPAFYGLSTLVMVLNTLEVDPQRVWRGEWRWYHEEMLDCCVPLPVVKENGINFDQFACLAACNGLNAKLTRATCCASESEFREAVQASTTGSETVIVASYSRRVLHQLGDGHFSPIGGYHPDRDLVLILDTARFKYPPHWIPLTTLWKAMEAIDAETGLSRGYVELSRRDTSSLVVFRVSSALTLQLSCSAVKITSNCMEVFLKTWSSWLLVPAEEDSSSRDVAESAVECLIRALTVLPAGEFVLTTQIDVESTETLSSEQCQAALEMVSAMEKLPLFSLAKESADTISCVDSSQSECHVPGSAALFSGAQCGLSELTPAHYVTMLLLSWPKVGRGYGTRGAGCAGCGGGDGQSRLTNGTTLQKYVDEQLANSAEILRVEVDQLRQQLTSLMTYCNQCCDRKKRTLVE